MKDYKEKSYKATVKVVDDDVLQSIADEFYGGDVKSAIQGELGWLINSGLSVELNN